MAPNPAVRESSVTPGKTGTLQKGSCDCHFHVFGPYDRYPLQAGRSYTPPEATIELYRKVMSAYGVERGVIVQPSIYGNDLSLLVDVLKQYRETMRGVVSIAANIEEATLRSLDDIGVRGVRYNLLFSGGAPISEAQTIANRIGRLGWHLQVLTDLAREENFYRDWSDLPVPLVIDHFGHFSTKQSVDAPGFRGALRLIEEGKAWIKLSGVYRVTDAFYPFDDALPLVKKFIEANPNRIIWGSDWPHPAVPIQPKIEDLIRAIEIWLPGCSLQNQVLVRNPEALYGFDRVNES